ncbi:MAG: hypothetical protein K2F74_04480, partial [Muribaculaceae bacterium]|nr:hypothetical protein [Muribaculaceae bacterium]
HRCNFFCKITAVSESSQCVIVETDTLKLLLLKQFLKWSKEVEEKNVVSEIILILGYEHLGLMIPL